jgi:hypothetical protein
MAVNSRSLFDSIAKTLPRTGNRYVGPVVIWPAGKASDCREPILGNGEDPSKDA